MDVKDGAYALPTAFVFALRDHARCHRAVDMLERVVNDYRRNSKRGSFGSDSSIAVVGYNKEVGGCLYQWTFACLL